MYPMQTQSLTHFLTHLDEDIELDEVLEEMRQPLTVEDIDLEDYVWN